MKKKFIVQVQIITIRKIFLLLVSFQDIWLAIVLMRLFTCWNKIKCHCAFVSLKLKCTIPRLLVWWHNPYFGPKIGPHHFNRFWLLFDYIWVHCMVSMHLSTISEFNRSQSLSGSKVLLWVATTKINNETN